jgi:hypothetical protein
LQQYLGGIFGIFDISVRAVFHFTFELPLLRLEGDGRKESSLFDEGFESMGIGKKGTEETTVEQRVETKKSRST